MMMNPEHSLCSWSSGKSGFGTEVWKSITTFRKDTIWQWSAVYQQQVLQKES